MKTTEIVPFLRSSNAQMQEKDLHPDLDASLKSIDFLEKLLSAYPNINANWLISGIGYMHSDITKNEVVSNKKIGKVVVFYDDNSFEQLNS